MSLILPLAAMVLFSVIAFWKYNALTFMMVAGLSIMSGFYWYDVFTDDTGLSISLVLIAYSFVCVGFAFRLIFWKEGLREEMEDEQ